MQQLILNASLILPDRVEKDAALLLDGTIIKNIYLNKMPLPTVANQIDAGGRYVAPGFIDIHVHGGGGIEVNRSSPEDIARLCEAHSYYGTTSILPTTLTASFDDLLTTIDQVKAAVPICKSNILGIHLEGPYLSPNQAGAQNPEFLLKPTSENLAALLERWDGIRMMGIAPELPGGMAVGEELRKRGITASMAHSDCTFAEAEEARVHGFTDVTHLYSGCSMVKRVNAYRVAGLVEAGLFFDDLTVQIIADGKHLPPTLLKLIYKCKGADRIALITDGLSHAATDVQEGESILQANGMEMVYEDGVFKLPDRQAFAGSAATTDRLFRNMVELVGVSLSDAAKMASTTPAAIIGATQKGSIAPGKDADLVFLSADLQVEGVMIGGIFFREFLRKG